ncbi:NAD(P)-dependent oxidoreductase [Chloroflexi bacterium TSY]|nr:NAD(P)-dependent oxidoreductase [Chloroflexi bacterium TSY]
MTGMSGLIGGVVRERLQDRYKLSALNRSDVPGVPCHRTDIDDLAAIQPAFDGIDLVIHLAANASMSASWNDILQTNIVGTYNVFEAARQAGVQRIIYASSGSTTSGWEKEMPFSALAQGRYDEAPVEWPMLSDKSPVRPSGIYGTSKVFGEALARHITDTSDLSIICLRIGHVTRDDKPTTIRDYSVWCSQRDIAQMIEKCVAAPASLKYDIFYVVSNNKWSYRDLAHAREVVGYEPLDSVEDYRE